eukprot:m.75016 g.75016  ORF g.75016 m.75016 type:complete len:51 (-) comp8956_c0_seq1:1026-1178(-)
MAINHLQLMTSVLYPHFRTVGEYVYNKAPLASASIMSLHAENMWQNPDAG